jgi:hypothetical protein
MYATHWDKLKPIDVKKDADCLHSIEGHRGIER